MYQGSKHRSLNKTADFAFLNPLLQASSITQNDFLTYFRGEIFEF